MRTLNIAISFLFLFIACASFAQTGTANSQHTYTYEQAVAILTAHEQGSEFQTKSIAPSIGRQIHTARSRHNISISTLSFITGLKEEDLKRIEDDKVVPTRDIIAKIQDFLGEEIVLPELN